MTRTLPCCGCACSATRLFGCHPSRCSPPLFHSHVRVNSTLGVRTACLASRVACVRAWSWLSHPRPPDRSQHGCTVGVLPGPTRVLPMPKQYGIGRRAPTRAVLVGVLWCAYTVCGLCRQYVLYCVLSHHQKRRKPPSEEEKTPTRRGENPHQKRRKPTEEINSEKKKTNAIREIRALSHQYHVGVDLQHSSTAMLM